MPYREVIQRDPDPIVDFEDELLKTIRYLKENKKECIIMAQPVLWKSQMSEKEEKSLWFYVNTKNGKVRMSPEWLSGEMEKYNNLQEKLAVQNDCVYIPLDKLIPRDLTYIFDDCHFTDKGSHNPWRRDIAVCRSGCRKSRPE